MSDLSDKELQERRTFIGASEAAAVLGLDPFRRPIQVWQSKVEGIEAIDNRFTHFGRRLEAVVAEEYRERNPGIEMVKPGTLRHPKFVMVAATPDREVRMNGEQAIKRLLEIKTADARMSAEWGESGAKDGVPDYYVVQTLVQRSVWKMSLCDVAALIGGNDYRQYSVPWDEDTAGQVLEALAKFWTDYVATKKPPPVEGSEAYAKFLGARWSKPTELILDPPPEVQMIVAKLKATREAQEKIEKERTEWENRLTQFIGDAAGFKDLCTWKKTKDGKLIDWQGIAGEMNPPDELIEKYTMPKPGVRRLILK